MPPSTGKASDPLQWLEAARSDLAIASIELPLGGMYEQLCFHAQQAAEKSLKAVLLRMGVSFPFTHNLQLLLDLLPSSVKLPDEVRDVVELNAYAVLTRYPGEMEAVTKTDYSRALQIARSTFEWAENTLQTP
jgi:HEPN domain-containing protein